MRLLVYYAIQILFAIAGFTAVSVVFVNVNSRATSSILSKLVARTADVAAHRVLEPLNSFAAQTKVVADNLRAEPSLGGSKPSNVAWNEPLSTGIDPNATPPLFLIPDTLTITELTLFQNNPLAQYIYETFEMPDNTSQWFDAGIQFGDARGKYFKYRPTLVRDDRRSPGYVYCFFDPALDAEGRVTPALVNGTPTCTSYVDPVFSGMYPWQTLAKTMRKSDANGMWTSFYPWYDELLGTTSYIMEYGVPVSFTDPDPVTKEYYCNHAFMMDMNVNFLTESLRAASASGVDLALYWELDDSVLSWTIPQALPTGSVLYAGNTSSIFDDGLSTFRAQGWCVNNSVAFCTPPADGAAVLSDSRNIFTLRRITHGNVKFTLMITASREAYFGPGDDARTVGITVSVIVCALFTAMCLLLWWAVSSPLRSLVSNMALAARFSDEVDLTATSWVTEVDDANTEFQAMHAALQASKPFLPRHLLARLDLADDDDGNVGEAVEEFDNSRSVRFDDSHEERSRRSTSRSHTQSAKNFRVDPTSSGVVAPLQTHSVAVLACNVTGFRDLVKRAPVEELQKSYATLIGIIAARSANERGVVDTIMGDHVLVTFNSVMRCANPSASAVKAAFAIRQALRAAELTDEWCSITFGIATGSSLCGTLGSDIKVQATLGTPMRLATGLQRVARELTLQPPVHGAPSWCVATARVAIECQTFAHFRFEVVAKLHNITTVIALVFPPSSLAPLHANLPGALVSPVGSDHGGKDQEWLYLVDRTINSNPWTAHNTAVAERLAMSSHGTVNISALNEDAVDECPALRKQVCEGALPVLYGVILPLPDAPYTADVR